jgi:formylmethanofuran dehydrogenase subunit A
MRTFAILGSLVGWAILAYLLDTPTERLLCFIAWALSGIAVYVEAIWQAVRDYDE